MRLQDGVIVHGRMGHHDELVDCWGAHDSGSAARPADNQLIDVCLLTEAKMRHGFHLALVAASPIDDLEA